MEIQQKQSTGAMNTLAIASDGSIKTTQGAAGAAKAGVSSNASVGAVSAVVIAAATYTNGFTIQNTHASQSLYLSFNTPATTSDIALTPGASWTCPFGPTNALYGIGSGASTTYAIAGA